MVHDLYGAIVANKAHFGIVVTLEEPTKGMRNEALKYASYKFNGKMDIPLVQLLSAADGMKAVKLTFDTNTVSLKGGSWQGNY